MGAYCHHCEARRARAQLCRAPNGMSETTAEENPLSKRIVIIGGGPAGYEAALAGAKYGADITLIEDRGMGGSAVVLDLSLIHI